MAGSDQLKSAWNSASITRREHDDARDPVREHRVDAVGPSRRRQSGRPHGLAHHAVHALVARADDLEIEVAPVARAPPAAASCAASRTAAGTPTSSSGGASSIDSSAHVVHARVASPSPGSSRRTTADSDVDVALGQRRQRHGSRRRRAGCVSASASVRRKLVEPLPRARDDGHHRHAQVGGQARLVDGQALRPRLVDHVEGDRRRARRCR